MSSQRFQWESPTDPRTFAESSRGAGKRDSIAQLITCSNCLCHGAVNNLSKVGLAVEDWPGENDAVIAAPRDHKILLENENVRVLDVPRPGKYGKAHGAI